MTKKANGSPRAEESPKAERRSRRKTVVTASDTRAGWTRPPCFGMAT